MALSIAGKRQKSDDDLVVHILQGLIRGMKKNRRTVDFRSVCEEIERSPRFPTLADRVTTKTVRRVLDLLDLTS